MLPALILHTDLPGIYCTAGLPLGFLTAAGWSGHVAMHGLAAQACMAACQMPMAMPERKEKENYIVCGNRPMLCMACTHFWAEQGLSREGDLIHLLHQSTPQLSGLLLEISVTCRVMAREGSQPVGRVCKAPGDSCKWSG